MKYKVALFDLDDTLLRSYERKWTQHKHVALDHFGIEITDEQLHEHWGKPFLEMIALLYGDVAEPIALAKVIHSYNHQFPKLVFDGSVAAVDRLLDAGVQVGIVTSSPTELAFADLRRLGFNVDQLLCVLGNDIGAFHKPDSRVFEPALARLPTSVSRSEIVYVGDLLVDLEAAIAASFDFIGVTTGVLSPDALLAAGASCVVGSAPDAVDLILAS